MEESSWRRFVSIPNSLASSSALVDSVICGWSLGTTISSSAEGVGLAVGCDVFFASARSISMAFTRSGLLLK